jgi:hypothetical protein
VQHRKGRRPSLTLNELNPENYLRDTLDLIASGHPISRVGELMPWKAASS